MCVILVVKEVTDDRSQDLEYCWKNIDLWVDIFLRDQSHRRRKDEISHNVFKTTILKCTGSTNPDLYPNPIKLQQYKECLTSLQGNAIHDSVSLCAYAFSFL